MAVTKIHGIKTTVNKAIEYICNPDKTDQNLYISSFACSPETAALDFKYTLDPVSYTHLVQPPPRMIGGRIARKAAKITTTGV